MEFIFIFALLLVVATIAYVVLFAHRQESITAGGCRWFVKNDHLHVQNIDASTNGFVAPIKEVVYHNKSGNYEIQKHRGASSHTSTTGMVGPNGVFTGSSHTTHLEAKSWTVKGDRYNDVWLFVNNQERTNEKMLLEGPDVLGYADGGVKQQSASSYTAPKSVRLTPWKKFLLYRWLRHHGMSGSVDAEVQSAQINDYVLKTNELLTVFRERFNFKTGDLDHLRVNADLTPISYTKLSEDKNLLGHCVKRNLTNEAPVMFSVFSGDHYSYTHQVEKVYVPSKDKLPGDFAIISKSMYAKIKPVLEDNAKPLRYDKR